MPGDERDLTVAVTGPTGTLGFSLIPLLEADDRVTQVVGIARRAFDPAAYGWSKMEYRRGDVRDPKALLDAFGNADVMVHLAFFLTGAASREAIRSINVGGTLNAFRAAAAVAARRFVYPSSVAAYGFHPDNPVGMTEEWPVRPAAQLFYAQQKAELEHLLRAEAARSARPALYLLRPATVLGPHMVGAKARLPGHLAPLARRVARRVGRFRVPVPVPVPVVPLPLQFVHEEDVGQALLQCVAAAGPPGAYNIAADGIVTAADITRELGMIPLPLPAGPAQFAARAVAALPFLPPVAEWAEVASHPAIMDTTRAKQELGWIPRFTAIEALRDTLRQGLELDPTSPRTGLPLRGNRSPLHMLPSCLVPDILTDAADVTACRRPVGGTSEGWHTRRSVPPGHGWTA